MLQIIVQDARTLQAFVVDVVRLVDVHVCIDVVCLLSARFPDRGRDQNKITVESIMYSDVINIGEVPFSESTPHFVLWQTLMLTRPFFSFDS